MKRSRKSLKSLKRSRRTKHRKSLKRSKNNGGSDYSTVVYKDYTINPFDIIYKNSTEIGKYLKDIEIEYHTIILNFDAASIYKSLELFEECERRFNNLKNKFDNYVETLDLNTVDNGVPEDEDNNGEIIKRLKRKFILFNQLSIPNYWNKVQRGAL